MQIYLYDNTFEGLLTAIFEVYEYKQKDVKIIPKLIYQPDILAQTKEVFTDETKAQRVWKGLQKKLSKEALENFYKCYLSELSEREEIMLNFARRVFSTDENIEQDFGNDAVLKVAQIGRKLFREKHRFEAFVRFQKTADGIFYASVEPDFNVLPLIATHFTRRYADQEWIIYDLKRKYGLWYNKQTVQQIEIDFSTQVSDNKAVEMYDEKEELYQLLWKDYFRSTNIPARKNMKLHLQHVPVRYWKYLTEKQPKF